MNFTKASPTTTATLLLAANRRRTGVTLVNEGSVAVYINFNSGVTTSTGFPIPVGGDLEIEGTTDTIYGITASGTGDIRIAEMY